MNGDHGSQRRLDRVGDGRSFSQFSGLTGDIEGGVKYRNAQVAGKQQRRSAKQKRNVIRYVIFCLPLLLLGFWLIKLYGFFSSQDGGSKKPIRTIPKNDLTRNKPNEKNVKSTLGKISEPDPLAVLESSKVPVETFTLHMEKKLKDLFEIGLESRLSLVKVLEENDPFGVMLVNTEEFKCPLEESERFSVPDIRDMNPPLLFRNGQKNHFIYYQHLRKAGGTAFCDLAKRSMDKGEVPRYYCMPDQRGSMATPPWSNREYLLSQMTKLGHRITANEWDAFPRSHLTIPGAVFVTTMRNPIDRWYSQYRFEHLEHRDGLQGTYSFSKWYAASSKSNQGHNYYVKAFSGAENPSDENLAKELDRKGLFPVYTKNLVWSWRKFEHWGKDVSWENFSRAVDTLRRFHLVLILEILDSADRDLEDVLGWKSPPKLVRPHENKAPSRGKEAPSSARLGLSSEDWDMLADSNAYDLLLYHYGRRLFLERVACAAPKNGSKTIGQENDRSIFAGAGVVDFPMTSTAD